jgi:hypothetical protein
MRLFDRLLAWSARRRHLKHCRRLQKKRVFIGKMPPDPRCVVRNMPEPNK